MAILQIGPRGLHCCVVGYTLAITCFIPSNSFVLLPRPPSSGWGSRCRCDSYSFAGIDCNRGRAQRALSLCMGTPDTPETASVASPLLASVSTIRNEDSSKTVVHPPNDSSKFPKSRVTLAEDGTRLLIRRPSTQDLHQLGLGSMMTRGGMAMVAFKQEPEEEKVAAGVTVEVLRDCRGSSLATKMYLLHHTRMEGVSDAVEHTLLYEAINQFLNNGPRISQLCVIPSESVTRAFYQRHGLISNDKEEGVARRLGMGGKGGGDGDDRGVPHLTGDREAALSALQEPLQEAAVAMATTEGDEGQGQGVQEAVGGAYATLLNLSGRLLHDCGSLDGAVNAYMKAVQIDPSRGEVFRSLGGVYQSKGQHQMAFASFQQAIDLNQADLLAYMKLGMLYEELAVGKYEEAGDHAVRCFEYYLQHSGSEDTDVLTRLGNLQVLRLDPEAATKSYKRALENDPSLANVWFNLGNAYLKLDDKEEAKSCLQRALELNPEGPVSAKYLLASLESDPACLTKEDQVAYARELFDYYAAGYDDHVRNKLLYTGPRILRQTVKDVYNATFVQLPEEIRFVHGDDVLQYLNGSLSILDLGCGTGLCGSWFKDYGREIVGVDVSPKMLDMATKKGCYHELRSGDVEVYLSIAEEGRFDLVLAAEVFQYLGPLEGAFSGVKRVIKNGGYVAFTVDRLEQTKDHVNPAPGPISAASKTVAPPNFVLKGDGTYAYSREYLENLAHANDMEIVVLKTNAARVERGEPQPGFLGVFQKT